LKFYVNETHDAETQTIPRHWSDGIETRPRCSKNASRLDCLETKTFETETTTPIQHLGDGREWWGEGVGTELVRGRAARVTSILKHTLCRCVR